MQSAMRLCRAPGVAPSEQQRWASLEASASGNPKALGVRTASLSTRLEAGSADGALRRRSSRRGPAPWQGRSLSSRGHATLPAGTHHVGCRSQASEEGPSSVGTVPLDESSTAESPEEASQGSGTRGTPPLASRGAASPLPQFMVDQAALLASVVGEAPVQEAQVPGKRRAPPKKLPAQDKATAPWGWEAKAAAVGSATWREDRSLGELEKWLSARGLPQQKLELRLVKEGGRGLVARSDVGKGEALLFVPEDLMMTPDKAYASSPAGPLLQSASVPEWPALAVLLLLEAAQGPQSQWSTYIATLPSTPPCILQWSAEEVDVLLKGSPVQRKAIECIADVTATFRDLDAVLFSKHRDVFPEELFTLGLFKWAFAVLFSRLVRLPSKNGQLALVPWADMLNHRCEVESYLDYDSWKKAVVFKTDRKFQAGKEVFASYGPRSNGSLLLAYGVVPTSRNPNDTVDLTLGFDPADPDLPRKQAALREQGLTAPLSFPLQMEGWPSQLLAFLRLSALDATAPQDLVKQLAAEVASKESGLASLARPGAGAGKGALSLEGEVRAMEALVAACQVALGGYQTTLQEDEAVLAGISEDYLEDDGEQRIRVLAATALRVGERRILLKTDFVTRAELRDLRARLSSKRDGKAKIDLGNNLGGEKGSKNPLERFLGRIVRP